MIKNDINLRVVRLEYNIPTISFDASKNKRKPGKKIGIRQNAIAASLKTPSTSTLTRKIIPEIVLKKVPTSSQQDLIEQLLTDIYGCGNIDGSISHKDGTSDSNRCTSASPASECPDFNRIREADLLLLNMKSISELMLHIKSRTQQLGSALIKRLFQRDALRRRRSRLCNIITTILKRIYNESDGDMRFSVSPKGGACGWAEWLKAMRLVARLPTGIPPEFRKKLWITLAEQHLKVKGVDWAKAERTCFSEWTNPDDTELGVQIVKDLHRTGCSLFCGSEGRENQAVLKRVLLAYARWNKAVGYCQGFNMLAALILEVMDRSESDSLKVMIYLIEAVLPEGYFANNLRGLSVDMAVFRDLLKLRLPRLSAHLEKLQKGAAEGSCYEPPLTNVFTMQWFLTLFCNCLPRTTVLRVWDLVFLEGDEILLTTALAIWDTLQDRILVVESADEFYSVMGELARQTLEAPPSSSEALLARAAQLGPVPELPRLRDKHRYNITPWAHSVQSAAKKGLRLFYSEDETDSSDEGDKLAITTAYGLQASGRGRGALVAAGVFGHPDRERLALDISALKQQYARLRERQRQAHIILAAACARQPSVGAPSGTGPISVNHLLLGKSAIVSARGRRLGPPQGAIPPSRNPKPSKSSTKNQLSSQTKNDTLNWKDENHKKSLIRRDSIKWRDIKQPDNGENAEEDPDEDGKVVPESEVNEIIQTSMRSRRKSESSSYSECSESSTSTSLCDEPNRMSDFDSEPASLSDNPMGIVDDVFRDELNNDKLISQKDTKKSLERQDDIATKQSDTEFGNYIQEFEDLLDRTNQIETDLKESPVSVQEQVVIKDSDAEFGNYIQEFEDLLDRTNTIESDIKESPISIKESKEFNENNDEFGNYIQEFEDLLDRTNTIESDIKESPISIKESKTFNKSNDEFGNYIQEFEGLLDKKNTIEFDVKESPKSIQESKGFNDSNNEFGSYVQEYESLLNRTNSIESVIKESPKSIHESKGFIENNDEFGSYVKEFDVALDKTNQISVDLKENSKSINESKINSGNEGNTDIGNFMQVFDKSVDNINMNESQLKESPKSHQETKDFKESKTDFENAHGFEIVLKNTNQIIAEKEESPKSFLQSESIKEVENKQFENYVHEYKELSNNTNLSKTEVKESPESNQGPSVEISPNDNLIKEKDLKKSSEIVEIDSTFVEFVDSYRGEPLRNYLDEFRKAGDANKQVKLWATSEHMGNASNEAATKSFDTELESKPDEVKKSFFDNSDSILESIQNIDEQKCWDSAEETSTKQLVFTDFRSNSCERSVSSSISSVSPVLRTTSGFAEDSPSFLCYKSPTRQDSYIGSELSEDEKPIVLKIDKYFEHSPEFFGARKSGTYISSDEEDEPNGSKGKRISMLAKKSDNLLFHSTRRENPNDACKYSNQQFEKHMKDEIYQIKKSKPHIPFECEKTILKQKHSDYNNSYVLTDETSDKTGYFIPSSTMTIMTDQSKKKLKILSPESIESSFELKSPVLTHLSDKSPLKPPIKSPMKSPMKSPLEKNDDSLRYSILEKTKSEELPSDQKRSFSMLDEEIEAIRSQSGRRNSERALRIIQENSKILHRILVNQVNKTSLRDSFQEEPSESFTEEADQREKDRKELRLFEYRNHKPLISPRSASLDESFQRKNKNLTLFSEPPLDVALQTPSKSKDISPLVHDRQILSKISLQLKSPNNTCLMENPSTFKLQTPIYEKKIKDFAKFSSKTSPSQGENNKTSVNIESPTTFKLQTPIYEKKLKDLTKFSSKTSPNQSESILKSDENKTDMFGWENKGFNANQRIYKSDFTSPKSYNPEVISSYIDKSKSDYEYEIKEKPNYKSQEIESKISSISSVKNSTKKEVELHLNPVNYNLSSSPDIEKNSTLTVVSDAVNEPADYSVHDFTESWKMENNNSISDSYNLSSPYKFTFKSTENSGYIDGVFKNLQKFNDSPLSRVSDTFSRVTECSPMDSITRPEALRFETSQSSDLCIVSSSMSFSFDPSIDDQPSSKPTTFNSSDTLCQLTSLDQVSTPISPKIPTYPQNKDATGISQNELSLELDKFRLTSEDSSCIQGSFTDPESACISSLKTSTSPTSAHEKSRSLKSPDKIFNPFPVRTSSRQPKELGLRLGLYKDPLKSPAK